MPSQAERHLKAIIAANLKAARDAAGLTQLQLASRAGTDPMNISRWERARVMPTTDNLAGVAAALGRDIAWFYTDHTTAAA